LVCTKCEKDLPLEDFPMSKNRGKPYRLKRCKKCTAEYKHQHYLKQKERYKERAKRYREENDEHVRKIRKEYREKHKEELRRKSRERITSERGRELNRLRSRKYREKQEGKLKDTARTYLYFAIRGGKVIRPDKCSVCGEKCKPEAHHKDYNKPLDVVWVCKHCHENIHHPNEGHAS
jgi:hypothetical protein